MTMEEATLIIKICYKLNLNDPTVYLIKDKTFAVGIFMDGFDFRRHRFPKVFSGNDKNSHLFNSVNEFFQFVVGCNKMSEEEAVMWRLSV